MMHRMILPVVVLAPAGPDGRILVPSIEESR